MTSARVRLPAKWERALLVMASAGLIACDSGERKTERASVASSGSVPLVVPSSKPPSQAAEAAAPAKVEPPWEKFDKSRCAFDVAPLQSTNAVFAAARQLRDRAELDALVAKGIAGTPERLGLRVEGTYGARCECEPFHAWFAAPEKSFTPIINIENKGVPNLGFGTALSFIVVGYFSGAYINIYEQRRVQGVEPREPDEEERPFWPKRAPEFCVEALCYWPPQRMSDAELAETDDRTRFLHMVGTKHIKHMATRKIPRCTTPWTPAPRPRSAQIEWP